MARSGSLLAVLDKPRNVSRCAAIGVGRKADIVRVEVPGGDCGGHQATREGDAEQRLRHRRAKNAEQVHAAVGDQRLGQHDRQNGVPFPEPQPM